MICAKSWPSISIAILPPHPTILLICCIVAYFGENKAFLAAGAPLTEEVLYVTKIVEMPLLYNKRFFLDHFSLCTYCS